MVRKGIDFEGSEKVKLRWFIGGLDVRGKRKIKVNNDFMVLVCINGWNEIVIDWGWNG